MQQFIPTYTELRCNARFSSQISAAKAAAAAELPG